MRLRVRMRGGLDAAVCVGRERHTRSSISTWSLQSAYSGSSPCAWLTIAIFTIIVVGSLRRADARTSQ